MALKIIGGLARFRGLSYFAMVCTTLCTELNANVDVQALAADLPLWDISAQVVNTVNYGDPIAAYRVYFSGRLLEEENCPPISLISTATSESIALGSIIDINRNLECFSITCIPTASLDFTSIGNCLKQPLPIAVLDDTIITAADIVLHPYFPAIEGDTRGTASLDRNAFLIPF